MSGILKIIGITAIVLSFTAAGMSKAFHCRSRVDSLEQAKAVFITIMQRMAFTLAEPNQLIEELCENSSFKCCDYLYITERELKNNDFEIAWKTAVDKSEQPFQQKDRELIGSMGPIIGQADLQTQLQQLEQLLRQIEDIIDAAKNKCEEKQRMFISIGALAGLMVSVLLI